MIEHTRSAPDVHGVYEANVLIAGVQKKARSSFFPAHWSLEEIDRAIEEAYKNRRLIRTPETYRGRCASGIELEMQMDAKGQILTVYPRYERGRLMLRFTLYEAYPGTSVVDADFEDEPEPRKWFLSLFIIDMYGQEDLYLAELAKAEAGGTGDIYNHYIHAYFYPDLVVLEDMRDSEIEGRETLGPRNCTRLGLCETKQLIVDWVQARRRWYEQKDAAASA